MAANETTYTVKAGDTLSKIAENHYGKGNAGKYTVIFEANRNILNSPDVIQPGQVLCIPALAVGGETTYTVKAGDTLSKIAENHYGKGNAGKYTVIFEANRNILSSPDVIKPGQVLRIPSL